MIIAIDFDGVLCDRGYPSAFDGEPCWEMIELVYELKKMGHCLIMWTCREGEALEDAKRFCLRYGIEFDYFNENCPENIEKFGVDSRKIGADMYIDDRAVSYHTLKRFVMGY